MTMRTISVSPPHSVILIMDRSVGVVPETLAGGLVASTTSCLAVGTLPEHDGETWISLSNEDAPTELGSEPVFDAILHTPSRVLSVCSVLHDVLLELELSSEMTSVQVWANGLSEPDVLAVRVVAGSEGIDT